MSNTCPTKPADSHILITDDNEQNVELLQAYLEPLGYTLHAASDGLQAVRFVEAANPAPDLILLDVMMPRMSGFEACRAIKNNPATAHIAILMVTALNESSDLERAVEAGTDDFLTKPVARLELVARVKTLLRIAALRKAGLEKDAVIHDLEQRLAEVRQFVNATPEEKAAKMQELASKR